MLVQVRVGPEKWKIRQLVYGIRRSCGIYGSRVIPHISMYGDFTIGVKELPRVVSTIRYVASKYDTLPFYMDGYDFFEGEHGYVCALKIVPSDELKEFRRELCYNLSQVAPSTKPWDNCTDEFKFHITIAHRLNKYRSDQMRKYLESNPSIWRKFISLLMGSNHTPSHPYLPMEGIRVTLLNDNRTIRCEYDLIQKQMLDRQSALRRDVYSKSMNILRTRRGMQRTTSNYKPEPSLFLYADTHFDHDNIIRFCGRPFSSVFEMNDVLKNNWNSLVCDADHVFFLGDMAHGRRHDASYWQNKLNGDITLIRGNHDSRAAGVPYEMLSYKGHDFLLVHSPDKIPVKWDGWIIHGHKHNNDVYNYPFINGERKTINVGAELVNYQPIDLDRLLSLDIDSIRRMDTIGSIPERW